MWPATMSVEQMLNLIFTIFHDVLFFFPFFMIHYSITSQMTGACHVSGITTVDQLPPLLLHQKILVYVHNSKVHLSPSQLPSQTTQLSL